MFNEYKTLETGTYKFGEWSYEAREEWELTLTCGDNETVWRITDADKNKNGYKYYVSDVISGIGFPGPILTKIWDPNFVLPTEFCFTDVANPDRSFITGRADLRIPNDF